MERTNRIGLKYELIDVGHTKTMIKHGDKKIIVSHPIDRLNQSWYDWQMKGEMIQSAFPYLTPDEREFLMTAITTTEWDAIFKQREE